MAHTTAPARSIEEYLKQHKNLTDPQKIQVQREERKEHFIKEIQVLFQQIEGWLHGLAEDGPVFYRERPISIYEEGIGEYQVSEMLVDIADRLIIIRPIGTMVYGALGRVDILSAIETHLLMQEWGKWMWDHRSYLPGSGSKPLLVDLTEKRFKDILFMHVSG